VIESVIPAGPAFNLGKWTDLQMLVCVGGREPTESEYRALFASSGFNLQEVVATASPLSRVVAKNFPRVYVPKSVSRKAR
jgi:hypothetical protein